MKSKREKLCHKSGSPAKRRQLFASLLRKVAMNMQRANPFHRSSTQEHGSEERSRFNGDGTPMDMRAISSTPFHGQRGVSPPFPSDPTGALHVSAPGRESVNRPWYYHSYESHQRHHVTPQTPSHRSWDLTSPPKPRRVASASTAAPFHFPAQPSTYSYPVQARYAPPQVPRNIKMSTMTFYHQVVGDPSLKIFRVRLPPHLLHLLDGIVLGCEAHAATLPNGWLTELYSLTKQDIALRKIPHLYDATKPITSYMKRSIMALLGVHSIKVDRNQPHVLKVSWQGLK